MPLITFQLPGAVLGTGPAGLALTLPLPYVKHRMACFVKPTGVLVLAVHTAALDHC